MLILKHAIFLQCRIEHFVMIHYRYGDLEPQIAQGIRTGWSAFGKLKNIMSNKLPVHLKSGSEIDTNNLIDTETANSIKKYGENITRHNEDRLKEINMVMD